MTLRIMGAVLVVAACAGFGFRMAAAYRRQEQLLLKLLGLLEFMGSELEYRMTDLPTLCEKVAGQASGPLKKIFMQLALELRSQVSPDADCCMAVAVDKTSGLPELIKDVLRELGRCLGQFDLQGQLHQLELVKARCAGYMDELRTHRDQRTRSYQTLGICTGIALAILLI